MKIELREIPFPSEDIPPSCPQIAAEAYEQRVHLLYSKAGVDWVVVYGDREHLANLAFLTGYDPRFEEALLLVGPRQQRFMVVGNEGRGYVPLTTPWVDALLCQSLSLAGQPRSDAPRLADVLGTVGIGRGARVGVVGWKYLEPEETDDPTRPAFVPAYMVDVLRSLVGADGSVTDVTHQMMHPTHGLRANNSAAQIAAFEWSAMRASACVFRLLHGLRPGMSEFEAVGLMRYEGDPLSAHIMCATGKGNIVGLRSPSAKRIELGDGATTAASFWGSLVCRAGMVLDQVDEAFFTGVVTPYFRAMATWYQTLRIGVTGGEIHKAVTAAFGNAPFNSMLNPGHLVSFDEWVHTPIRPGSTEAIASGMALQTDIIPYPLRAGQALNCEDTLAIADASLRAELQSKYPDVWARIGARRAFMRDQLGITLADEVLPLSTAPAYLPPFWLKNKSVCAVA
ncbi:MAG: Xaa-Pro aminopeptidase [Chloroflexi bacterium]|nr:Xaa-Pro aminopeptidase [Chloroflexota bacterium]